MGVTGSGKSTIGRLLADDVRWRYIDADDFHSAANIQKMKHGIALNDADRQPWLERLRELIIKAVDENTSVVLACSALKESYRRLLTVNDRVKFVYLNGNYDLINERLRARTGHYMNSALLESQFTTLEEPADCLRIDISQSAVEIVAAIKQYLALEYE